MDFVFRIAPCSSLIFVMCHPSRGEPLCDCRLAAILCGSVQVVCWILLYHQRDCYTGQSPERRPHIPYHHGYTVREASFLYTATFFVFTFENSNKHTMFCLLTAVPAPPTHLQVVNVTDTRAVLQWTPSLGKVDRFIISYESSKSECSDVTKRLMTKR